MRRGFLGGSFDPPHLGHLILTMNALEELALDHLAWILTPVPPHKPDRELTPVEIRTTMVEAALADTAEISLSRIEIDRPPPHYAADTMEQLRQTYPQDTLVYLIGEDSLRDLPDWHNPERFLAQIDILGVMRRPEVEVDPAGLEESLPGLSDRVEYFSDQLIEISSSLIRGRVRAGKRYRYLVTDPVRRLIELHGLYRSPADPVSLDKL